jgi:polyhydroxyalkanoate synthesis regulator protein
MSAINPMASMPGFEAMRAQQEALMKAMTGGLGKGWSGPSAEEEDAPTPASEEDELSQIKRQLAELQNKLSKL